MANSIDQLNYYDDLVRAKSLKMSDEWISQISSLIDVLVGYLQPYGILIPQVTTAQKAEIQSPVEGQMIYNIDATVGPPRSAEIQIWQVKAGAGAWRTVTTVP
jgi:hypothetical protein